MAEVSLLAYTPDPERVVAVAARVCYSPAPIAEILSSMTKEETARMLRMLVERGHMSPLEHACFTFGVEGISRVASHQLVRHRIASYSQNSQRYISLERELPYVVPPAVEREGGSVLREFERFMREAHELYRRMVQAGIPKEDARFVLPSAVSSRMVFTMNARELHHFFELRLCARAQHELRSIARLMLERLREVAPVLFERCGPPCRTRGVCREGNDGCPERHR